MSQSVRHAIACRLKGLITLIALAPLGLLACMGEPEQGTDVFALSTQSAVGLYTPGNVLGFTPARQDAADGGADLQARQAAAAARQTAGLDPCAPRPEDLGLSKEAAMDAKLSGVNLANRPASRGDVTLSFKTKVPGGKWKPANVGAVWIADAQLRFVKKLEVWAAERSSSLAYFQTGTCSGSSEVDVISGPTLETHDKLHTAVWKDGKDFRGQPVPDGEYVVRIEVSDVERVFGLLTTVKFTKGPMPVNMTIADDAAVTNLQFTYAPSVNDPSGGTKP
jgi:hypothetical protein